MLRSYLAIIFLAWTGAALANPAHQTIFEKWAVAAEKCRGGVGDGYDTERACGERDAYMDALHIMGACRNESADTGCEL